MLLVLCFDLSLVLLKVLLRAAVERGDGQRLAERFISNEAKGGKAISKLECLGCHRHLVWLHARNFIRWANQRKRHIRLIRPKNLKHESSFTAARSAWLQQTHPRGLSADGSGGQQETNELLEHSKLDSNRIKNDTVFISLTK